MYVNIKSSLSLSLLTLEIPNSFDQHKHPWGVILHPPPPPDIFANISQTTKISKCMSAGYF